MSDNSLTSKIYYQSPVGRLQIEANKKALTAIQFINKGPKDDESAEMLSKGQDYPVLREASRQLDEYFQGHRKQFDLPVAPAGTAFQQTVWTQLQKISYGQTQSYGEVAQQLGDANKVRAVGTANGRNPIPIVIPCHRVIGANQKLVGYAGGIERKRTLLQHEGAVLL